MFFYFILSFSFILVKKGVCTMAQNHVKLGKLGSKKSLMDVLPLKMEVEENGQVLHLYKLLFNAVEFNYDEQTNKRLKGSKSFCKAYLSLSKAGLLAYDIVHMKMNLWNEENGVYSQSFYGGGKENGVLIARIFNVSFDSSKKKFIFTIHEGEGIKTFQDGVQMKKVVKTTQAHASLQDTREMFHDVLDYINAISSFEVHQNTFFRWHVKTSENDH
jgi:hypothetical protein